MREPRDQTPHVGDVYERASSTKSSTGRPRIRVIDCDETTAHVKLLNFVGRYGFSGNQIRKCASRR